MKLARTAPFVIDSSQRGRSDAEVERGLAAGEGWALTEVWRRFAPRVTVSAERALGSKSEAEDVAQDTFSLVFRELPKMREPVRLDRLIDAIALRTLRSHLRRRRHRRWLSFREPDSLVDLIHATQEVEARERVRSFYALLERLSPRDRRVFILRRVESKSIGEVARATELSPTTVKRSFSHASKRLSHWIAADPALAALLAQSSGAARK